MDEQKNRSRAASKMSGDVFTDIDMNLDVPKTVFFGYTQYKATGRILKIFIGNQEVKEVKKGDRARIILDQTPFYAEAGGQIGDKGFIQKNNAKIRVTDTQKIADIFIHFGVVEEGGFRLNDSVQTQIDSERRLAIMRNHTATHLLQAALRTVLGSHIKQQGSLVTDDRLRFDFTHPQAVKKDEITKVEDIVNHYVLSCNNVSRETVVLDEARKRGALAFFAEKYGETVSVVSIGDFSQELCGGTHLKTIGQVGLFKIVSEAAIAQGIRRIEAKTGSGALEYIKNSEAQLEKISQLLKSSPLEAVNRVESQIKRVKNLEKEIGELRFRAIKGSLGDILKKATVVKGVKIIHHKFHNTSVDILRRIADDIKNKEKSAVVALGSQVDENVFILITVTDNIIKKGIKANELIKDIAPLINGSGGGRPQLAQAGSRDASKLEAALKKTESLIKERL